MNKLSPKATWLFFLQNIYRWFFIITILAIYVILIISESTFSFSYELIIPLLILTIIITTAILWIAASLTNHYYRYELKDYGIYKESGIIWKSSVTIPYDRIQNIDIKRGVFERLLGLSDLQIQTAGASATMTRFGWLNVHAEGRIPSISAHTAEQLREQIIKEITKRSTRTQNL